MLIKSMPVDRKMMIRNLSGQVQGLRRRKEVENGRSGRQFALRHNVKESLQSNVVNNTEGFIKVNHTSY